MSVNSVDIYLTEYSKAVDSQPLAPCRRLLVFISFFFYKLAAREDASLVSGKKNHS